MGGVGKLLGEAAGELGEQMFSTFGKALEDDGGYGFIRSGRALLEKSPAGKILLDYLSKEMEPAVRKTGTQYLKTRMTPGLPPQQATSMLRDIGLEAWHDTRKIYLGKNDEVVVKAIAEGTRQRGPAYGNAMADVMSAYLHDSGSYWRKQKVTLGAGQRLALTDIGIRGTPKWASPSDFEQSLTHSLSLMRTQGIAIPHISQILNPMLREGIGNTAKALSDWTAALVKHGKPDKFFQDVIDSGVLYDEFRYEMLSDAKTPGASLFDKVFNHPAFNWVRRQQITISALAAKNHVTQASRELAAGVNTKMNTFTLNRLGVDTNALAQRGFQLTNDDLQKAMYQGGVQNMFVRSELETPWKWNENFGMRLATQYKPFGYRQAKFITEAFKDSYKYGGPKELAKTIAVFGTFFPVMGELIKSLEDLSVGRMPQNPFGPDKKYTSEYFDAIGHAAGWGIFASLFRAGMLNYGKGYFEGPLFSTLDDILLGTGGHIIHGIEYGAEGDEEKAGEHFKAAARMAIRQFGIPGRAIAEQMKDDK